ncbi:MAG: HNH endonuclease signature motif containing protein [Ilumatobacteraceae bacterium]
MRIHRRHAGTAPPRAAVPVQRADPPDRDRLERRRPRRRQRTTARQPGPASGAACHVPHVRLPGCDTTFTMCEVHHLLPFEHGGPTDLANLIPLCSRHHHVVHDQGLELALDDDRTLTITAPDGSTIVTPIPGRQPADPITHERALRRARRTGRTSAPERRPTTRSSPGSADDDRQLRLIA